MVGLFAEVGARHKYLLAVNIVCSCYNPSSPLSHLPVSPERKLNQAAIGTPALDLVWTQKPGAKQTNAE